MSPNEVGTETTHPLNEKISFFIEGYAKLEGSMTKFQNTPPCPLCAQPSADFCSDRHRDYLRCPHCDLIFVPEKDLLDPSEEKARYDLHQNNLNDSGYRNFLKRLFQPLEKKLLPGASGLDFGSGPGPALSLMFEEAGYDCALYDLYYANDSSVFDRQYDFLTCSETMEHMFRPDEEFERFISLMKPGGWIGIMTRLHDEAPVPFENWHYKNDETHVCFFSKKSFQWLEKTHGLRLEFHSNGVALFQTLENGSFH